MSTRKSDRNFGIDHRINNRCVGYPMIISRTTLYLTGEGLYEYKELRTIADNTHTINNEWNVGS